MKEELKEFSKGEDEKLKNLLKEYVGSEDENFEKRVHSAHMGITLGGSNAGPDRGHVFYQGRPLCDDDSDNTSAWDIDDAHVVCKMLGFSRATTFSRDRCDYGDCPAAGIPFAMGGFKCTGSENHILDCPHDATVADICGTNGVTTGNWHNIVGVECE